MTTSRNPLIRLPARGWRRYWRDRRGAAAAEFTMVLTLLTIPLLNVVDLSLYVYRKMQVEYAVQVAAHAAYITCSQSQNLPATPNSYSRCPQLPAVITASARGTSLGTGVTITSITEDYYCIDGAGQLRPSSSFPQQFPTPPNPNNCQAAIGGSSIDTPGDYILVSGSYNFTSLFPGLSVAGLLTTPINSSAQMRIGNSPATYP
jgi:TadE-like protein